MEATVFYEGVEKLKASLAGTIDNHFGLTGLRTCDVPPNPERDRMVVAALLELAATLAVQDGTGLGAAQLFVNFLVHETYGEQQAFWNLPPQN